MTGREIRIWYLREVAKIVELDQQWQGRGDTLEERARKAWQCRHDLRLRAREMMEEPADVEFLRARDFQRYGNPDGPTFEDLAERFRSRGLSVTDAYEAILHGALSTDESVNKLFGL
jgi:hypothetical protein